MPKDLTAILDLVEVIENAPDIPRGLPKVDDKTMERFADDYAAWMRSAQGTIARLRKEREEAR
ncbi:MAG: hypothetical protein WC565_08520 [Parcubacteria group bacterium]|jgi:hypothetical protein